MATRPPHHARAAFVLTLLVAALALAPVVDALSARVSVRASGKVDPGADPSSLLPTWPTGTNDPCVRVRAHPGVNVDSGELLGQDCRSYICIYRVLLGGNSCVVQVNPQTTQVQFKILWMPASLMSWSIDAQGLNPANLGQKVACPGWDGLGSPVPPGPLSLAPCEVVPYWAGATRAELWMDVPANAVAAGTVGIYVGPPQ